MGPWRTGLVPPTFRRAFADPPAGEIWEWADEHVWLANEDAAEPGPYRSAKTPWTRRLQELLRHPFRWCYDFPAKQWVRIRISKIIVQKSSQSGFSEACFNGIRWRATFRPRNVIFAIDSEAEAKKVARRLLRSLELLDPNIFTGNPDHLKSLEFRLRGMELNFYGSFSSGKFANKQAPDVFVDEYEEHGQSVGDTSSLRNLLSRIKTTDGLVTALSKPKLEDGPINAEWKLGNREEFFVPCPLPGCGHLQPITFESEEIETAFAAELEEIKDEQTGKVLAILPRPLEPGQTRKIKTGRLVFDHCKDLLGAWNRLGITQGGAYYECAECKGRIEEHHKQGMSDRGLWLPLVHGDPTTVSQHMHDLLSTDAKSSWGTIINEFLDAAKAGAQELQGWLNHRLGKTRKVEANKTEEADIKGNIGGQPGDGFPPYRRGTVPFRPKFIILGADVGMDYVRWAVGAVAANLEDIAVFDWGNETGPDAIAEMMLTRTWPLSADAEKKFRISLGFMDTRFRGPDVKRACLTVMKYRRQHSLIPASGLGGVASRKNDYTYGQVVNYPPGFFHLSFRDFDAKHDLYITRLKKKTKRLWFPIDVMEMKPTDDPDWSFWEELCGERFIVAPGEPPHWQEPAPAPNHAGDAVKEITNGLRFYLRLKTGQITPVPENAAPANPAE